MDLKDLNPKEVKHTFSGVDIVFRPFTLADDIRNEEKFKGAEGLKKIFDDFDFAQISRIAWGQLTVESQKKIIKAVEVSTVNEVSGEESVIEMTPIDKFRHLLEDTNDQISLLTLLVKCKGLNIPDIPDVKKSMDQLMEAVLEK